MLNFYDDAPNYSNKSAVQPIIEAAYQEVCSKYLPELPADLNIWLTNEFLIPETGDGGFAYSDDTMSIAFDPEFKDKEMQKRSLRAIIFHEAYHLSQGHTRVNARADYKSALDSAIYEGCAVVFERDFAGSKPLWGEYENTDIDQLRSWRDELAQISPEEFIANDGELWQKWAFYDEESAQRWRLYKVGTWVVDMALAKSNLDILDLRHKSGSQITKIIDK